MTDWAAAYGHLGLMFGILGVILAIGTLYPALVANGNIGAFLLFPVVFWAVGVLFVVRELYEAGQGP